ncbi:leucyl aminopeptidase [Alkalibacillus salilacus]|uniref:Probable cytosol aminopeptidase n=1 Tax=Alkalibacillus salilacus TaxID=284582 RepID=A0ABT9VEX2_9BACI|nr:leucyl aminopeptidase [Alkalibacillus salilacus]MDQ0159496.1 leucyl aminopeptidase [Alkalibacillus salilacus]
MFTIIQEDLTKHNTDALIVGLFEAPKETQPAYEILNQALNNQLDDLVESGDVSTTQGHVSKVHTLGQLEAKRIYFVGFGDYDQFTVDRARQSFGRLFKQLAEDSIQSASLAIDSLYSDEPTTYAEAIGEAAVMAPYQLETYHTDREENHYELESLIFLTNDHSVVEAAEQGYALGNGANIARHLVNLPSNLLTAKDLAVFAENIADKHELKIDVFEREQIEELGMGALLAVNQGSDEPPRFIVMSYQGLDTWEDPVALVGKGITFDTGGYSLKPKDGIVGMKMDMGGAASVIGAMDAIGQIQPKTNVMALIPATDNMVSDKAFKPDDVIVSMSGKTIEIRNTDAEGRLAMADAVTYAKQQGASKIVDIATLTGGVVVALGDQVTGAMTNNQDWYDEVVTAANQEGELMWQLPYLEVYQKQVATSHIADLNNSPGRKAHAVMAGAFVGAFAEETPWVHLDIAGTAMAENAHDLGPKGPTGVMARTLAKAMMNQ